MEYKPGYDYQEEGRDMGTYGIDHKDHGNKIEIHGDVALRDSILELLNSNHLTTGSRIMPARFLLWMFVGAGLMIIFAWLTW